MNSVRWYKSGKQWKYWLGGLILASQISSAIAVEPSGSRKTVRLGVLPITDQSASGDQKLAEAAKDLILRAISERKEIKLTELDDLPVSKPLSEYGSELTIDPQALLGSLGNVDGIARFTITRSGVYKKNSGAYSKPYKALELQGRVLSVKDGLLMGRIYARGASYESGKKGAPVDIEKLLQSAVVDAVDQLVELLYIGGVAGNKKPYNLNQVRISLGSLDGLRPGAEVAFYDDDNELIGYGKTTEVDDGHSLVRVERPSSYARIKFDTRVRPIYNPPRYAAGLTVSQLDAIERHREEVAFGTAVGVAFLGDYIFDHWENIFGSNNGAATATTGGSSPPPPPPPPPP